jgi:hypothetical protein
MRGALKYLAGDACVAWLTEMNTGVPPSDYGMGGDGTPQPQAPPTSGEKGMT